MELFNAVATAKVVCKVEKPICGISLEIVGNVTETAVNTEDVEVTIFKTGSRNGQLDVFQEYPLTKLIDLAVFQGQTINYSEFDPGELRNLKMALNLSMVGISLYDGEEITVKINGLNADYDLLLNGVEHPVTGEFMYKVNRNEIAKIEKTFNIEEFEAIVLDPDQTKSIDLTYSNGSVVTFTNAELKALLFAERANRYRSNAWVGNDKEGYLFAFVLETRSAVKARIICNDETGMVVDFINLK